MRVAGPGRIFILFIVSAVVLTYPLGRRLFSHIPRGDEPVGVVPFFNLWTLQWNIDQLQQGYPRYWDAPIFAPDRGAFAFSETQPLSALLAAPLWLGLQSPAAGYNALVLLFLTLNGWFAYWLLRHWEVSGLSAFLAALVTQALPFVAQEMGVLQLIAVFGLLWSLLFLSLFLKQAGSDRPAWRTGFGLALGTPVTFFTCSYYGLCSVFFLPLAFMFQFQKKHLRLKTLAQLLAIGLILVLLSGPFLWAQQQHLRRHGFSRSAQTIENNSARLADYGQVLDHNLLYGRLLGLESGQGQRLFPGYGLTAIAILGLFGRQQPRVKRYLLVATLLAFGLSLGLRLDLGGGVPYDWIRLHVPGFGQLRSPFRFAALVQVHLALLAGFGLHNVGRWFFQYRSLILPVVAALVIIEALALPLPLQPTPPQPERIPWQTWLDDREPAARIVILPFAASNRVADFEQTTRWMLANRHFQGEMLNGYSGFFPQDHGQVREAMLQFPTLAGIDLLREKGIDFVLVFHNMAGAPASEAIQTHLPIAFHDEAGQVILYSIKAPD